MTCLPWALPSPPWSNHPTECRTPPNRSQPLPQLPLQALADRIEVDGSITEEVLADAAKKTEGFSGGLACILRCLHY